MAANPFPGQIYAKLAGNIPLSSNGILTRRESMEETLESVGSPDQEDLRRTLVRLSAFGPTVERSPRATIVPVQPTEGAAAYLESARLSLSQKGSVEQGRTLGEGGMGIVRLGRQRSLGREVAVKSLRKGASSPDLELKLLREAWITSAVEHPNVVPVYDLGVDDDGSPTLVMKRVSGVPWSELLAAPETVTERFGVPSDEWHLRILVSLSNAVSFAHSRGILHRDLKPDNVMIGSFGEVYLLDWGLAVALEADAAGRLPLARDAVEMAGTPAYMAPEMLGAQASRLGPRTDVYLLGAILYEILTDRPPHRGESLEALVTSVMRSTPTFGSQVPEEAAAICRRAMSKDPDDRYESVEDLRFAIEAFVRHRESATLSSDATARLVQLETQLADGEGVKRRQIYDALGECRFGYRAALRAWPGNEAARRGLERAVTLIVNHELRAGDAKAAEALLSELADAPADLTRRVAEAIAKSQQAATRLAGLDRDLDPAIGTRTRFMLALIFGAIWSIAPVVEGQLPFVRGRFLLGGILMVLFSLLVGVWARETLSKTAFNRRTYAILVLALVTNVLLSLAVDGYGIPREAARSLLILTWFFGHGALAIANDYRLYPTVIVTLFLFAVSVAFPAYGPVAASLSSAAFTVNIAILWRPARIFGPPGRV